MKQISRGLLTALVTFALGITITYSLRTSSSADAGTISLLEVRYAHHAYREAVLQQNLMLMRGLIDQYAAEHGELPRALEDLVRAGYLRAVPIDPMTGQNRWQIDEEGCLTSGTWYSWGIVDVHSKSVVISSRGTPYSEW